VAGTILEIEGVHKNMGYSHAARVGDTIYVAGQIAQDLDGRIVGAGDFEAQMRQVLRNLEQVLHEAGTSLDGLLKTTSYITDLKFLESYRTVR
jgi:enamine deaminase RidA (YjgF/YER057c/UK114 family)